MASEHVEHIARAFYEAEYPDEWENAPSALQQHFRGLACLAIATLNRQIRDHQTAASPTSGNLLLAIS
jgi:hypothetical protein